MNTLDHQACLIRSAPKCASNLKWHALSNPAIESHSNPTGRDKIDKK